MKIQLFLSLGLYFTSIFALDLNSLNTFEAKFKQKIINEQNASIEYSGKISAMKKNNVALWEYKDPIIKQIYYYNGELVIIEPELEQAIFAKLDQVPNILKLLQNAKQLQENVYETTFANTKYKIFTNENSIEKISYLDQLHNRVTINFYNQKVNQKIDKKRFIFKIPKNYDILKQN